MMKHIQTSTTTGRGFTLIETLVAISILTITMAAPFYAVEQSITAADVSRDELTGSMLAQEGVEYVRADRDGNYLYVRENPSSTQTWLYGVDGTTSNSVTSPNCFTPNYCTIDTNPNVATPIVSYTSTTGISPLNINSNYLYTQQSGGTQTPFTRYVQLIAEPNGREVQVVVTVKWTTRNIPYTTTVNEYLENWLP